MSDNETDRIYEAVFDRKVPEDVKKHFNILSQKIESRFPEEEVNKYMECIEKVHDLEALELAARHLKKLPLLTEKFKIMVYLAETRPENYNIFVNEEPGLFRGCTLLLLSALRTGLKMTKGLFIIMVNRI